MSQELPADLDPHDLAVLEAAEAAEPATTTPTASGEHQPPSKGHVIVTCKNGAKVAVHKTTLCYRLSENPRVSADRLIRVQTDRRVDRVAKPASHPDSVIRNDALTRNQWVVFCGTSGDSGVVVGRVLTFRFLVGTTEKRRQFTAESADVTTKDLGCVCSWFGVDGSGLLHYLPAEHDVRPLSLYKFSCPPPAIRGSGEMFYEGLVLASIQNLC